MRAKGFVQVARRQSTSQSRDHFGSGVTGVAALFRASTLRTRFARTARAAATSGGCWTTAGGFFGVASTASVFGVAATARKVVGDPPELSSDNREASVGVADGVDGVGLVFTAR